MNLVQFLILVLVCELIYVSFTNSPPKELEITLPKEKEILSENILFNKPMGEFPKYFCTLVRAIKNQECPPWADSTVIGLNGELGPLQILPILVEDINDFLLNELDYEEQHLYTLDDRLNLLKSIELFVHYYYKYTYKTTKDNIETIARRWNGGPKGDTKNCTIEYWHVIKAIMEEELGYEL